MAKRLLERICTPLVIGGALAFAGMRFTGYALYHMDYSSSMGRLRDEQKTVGNVPAVARAINTVKTFSSDKHFPQYLGGPLRLLFGHDLEEGTYQSSKDYLIDFVEKGGDLVAAQSYALENSKRTNLEGIWYP